jgi:hypothetical protein
MRCDTGQHRFYCGVDRHARTLFTHVLDAQGKTVFEKDLPTDPAAFLAALAPFRPDLVVGAECVFAWYWLADRCEDEPIPFALGHALAMNHTRCGPTAECSLTVADAAGRESPRADEGLDPLATRLPAAATLRGSSTPPCFAGPSARRGFCAVPAGGAAVAGPGGSGAGARRAVWCGSAGPRPTPTRGPSRGGVKSGSWPTEVARPLRCVVATKDAPGIAVFIHADEAIERFGVSAIASRAAEPRAQIA